jgi:hypothetical protein
MTFDVSCEQMLTVGFEVKKNRRSPSSLANKRGISDAIEQADRLFKTVRYRSTSWVALLRSGLQTGSDRANAPCIAPDGSTVSFDGQDRKTDWVPIAASDHALHGFGRTTDKKIQAK